MIRPFTCLAVLLAAGSGLYLYSEKHRTTLLDQRIDAVVADTGAIRSRTAMLQAEWALLNQPDRLGALAGRFLPTLQPIAPGQFVQVANLDKRLPPIGPPPPAADATVPAIVTPRPSPTPAAPPLLLSSATVVAAPPADPAPSRDAASAVPRAPDGLAGAARNAAAPSRIALQARHPARHRPALLVASRAGDVDEAAPAIRRVVSYARAAPILASAWSRAAPAYAPPAPAYAGSALGMAHDAMAPPMAAPPR